MRPPSEHLIVDANIILGVAFGTRSKATFEKISMSRSILTTERAQEEMLGVVCRFPGELADNQILAKAVLSTVQIIEHAAYSALLPEAERCLRDSVPSRNGTTNDAHVLALAWVVDADIWTHDRDFGGTGWPTWSSRNLLEAL